MTNEADEAEATVPWRNRIVGHGEIDPRMVKANEKNWRQHPTHQREALRQVLDEVGWVGSVVINRTTRTLIDGHLRIEEAIARDEPLVPYDEVELTEREEALVLASLDPLAALAVPDAEAFDKLLADLGPMEGALDGLLADLSQSLHPRGALQAEEPGEEAFWPRINVQVPPTVFKRWEKALDAQEKDNVRGAVSSLLKAAGY